MVLGPTEGCRKDLSVNIPTRIGRMNMALTSKGTSVALTSMEPLKGLEVFTRDLMPLLVFVGIRMRVGTHYNKGCPHCSLGPEIPKNFSVD